MTTSKVVHSQGFQARKALKSGFTYLVMILLAIIFLFPIVFMFITSIKVDEMQILSDVSTLWAFVPRGELGFDNYRDVFENLEFGRMLFNSAFIMVVTVLLGLVVNSMIAYALSRLSFKGRGLLLAIVVALIIVPFEAVAVPLLLVVNNLPWFGGATTWLDTYHVQIIPFIADAFSIFLFYQFFISIPKELESCPGRWCGTLPHLLAGGCAVVQTGICHRGHPDRTGKLEPLHVAADGHQGGGRAAAHRRDANLFRAGSSHMG